MRGLADPEIAALFVAHDFTAVLTSAQQVNMKNIVLEVMKQDMARVVTEQIMDLFHLPHATEAQYGTSFTQLTTQFPRAEIIISTEVNKIFTTYQAAIKAGTFNFNNFIDDTFVKIVASAVEMDPEVVNNIGKTVPGDDS